MYSYLVFLIFVSYLICCSGSPIANTTEGISYAVIFDTPILLAYRAGTSLAPDPRGEIKFVWGAAASLMSMYKQTNPNMRFSKYFPWTRDFDPSRNITWWQANHPTWVMYKCDGVTPAKQFTDPHIVLDITNPDVVDWQINNIVKPAMNNGYDYMAADNFALINVHQGCGVRAPNGTFLARYNGSWEDPFYARDALNWLQIFRQKLRTLTRPLLLSTNFVIQDYDIDDPMIVNITDNIDLVLDEAGYTNWADKELGMPDEKRWLNIINYQERVQSLGKAYVTICEFNTLDVAAKNWAYASYMISKGPMHAVLVTTVQGYGFEPRDPKFDALNIGSPTGARYYSQGVWMRMYSGGLAIVNANKNFTATITLPGDTSYVDVSGNKYEPGQSIFFNVSSGLVLSVALAPTSSPTSSPTQRAATVSPTATTTQPTKYEHQDSTEQPTTTTATPEQPTMATEQPTTTPEQPTTTPEQPTATPEQPTATTEQPTTTTEQPTTTTTTTEQPTTTTEQPTTTTEPTLPGKQQENSPETVRPTYSSVDQEPTVTIPATPAQQDNNTTQTTSPTIVIADYLRSTAHTTTVFATTFIISLFLVFV